MAILTLSLTQSVTRHFSRSHDAVIRVYDAAGNVTETHEHAGEFKECLKPCTRALSPEAAQ